MPITITRERPDTADSILLILELEAYLDPLYPDESQHGLSIPTMAAEGVPFFVLRWQGTPAACGAVRLAGNPSREAYGEVKRMYVRPQFRGLGLAKAMLAHLGAYTRQQGIDRLRLETGIFQPEAIALYERVGFYRIPPFGNYTNDPLSVFFEQPLR